MMFHWRKANGRQMSVIQEVLKFVASRRNREILFEKPWSIMDVHHLFFAVYNVVRKATAIATRHLSHHTVPLAVARNLLC